MKETGLMFKAPLVRSILDGSKTQTRRVLKWKGLQPGLNLGFSGLGVARAGSGWVLESNSRTSSEWRCQPTQSPMGAPGDRIYVRETFAPFERNCFYRADGDRADLRPWKPAIHMPKALARIWLDITGVRVERLQQISEADAKAEGSTPWPCDHARRRCEEVGCTGPDHRAGFQHLWESTGGDWAANPWVWVIDFKRDLAQGGQ